MMPVSINRENEELELRDRRVIRLENFSDEEMAQVAAAEVPAQYAHLDVELTGWRGQLLRLV